MTDEKIQTLKDDIAFMRALAQEGSSAPLLGGSILVAAGAYFSLASLVHWALRTGLLPMTTPWLQPVVWFAALGLFLVTLAILRARMKGRPGGSSPGNRATGTAWASMGWTICAIGAALAVISIRTQDEAPMMVFPSLILGLYGMGWSVAAAMSGKRWLWATAIGSYLACLLAAWYSVSTSVYLVYAAALVLLAVLPGLLLMRQEPGDTI